MKAMGAGAAMLAAQGGVKAGQQGENQPNILFFLADDHRADLMGCAGHPILKTPTMDRLAAEGVRFENMFVTTSICAASRASIFTGLYERTHGYTFGKRPIPAQFCQDSYPTLMRAAGYRTGFIGKYGVGSPKGEREEMFDYCRILHRHPYWQKQPDGSKRHISEVAGDHAIEFLQSHETDQPFCLSVSFNAPHAEDGDKRPGIGHYPWPKAVDGMYDDIQVPRPHLCKEEIFESQPKFLKESLNRKRYFWRWDTEEKWQKNVRAYFRMLSGIDHVMDRVLQKLEELGLADNTVVIYSGDNGYYLASRGFAGKWSHYEQSLRVPLIISDPRQPKGQRGRVVEPMALNVDIPATMLTLAGLQLPHHYQGRSVEPMLRGTEVDWRDDFFCEHLMDHPRIPKWEGVRGRRYKYARYFEQDPPYEFLHDLKKDPEELKNFADDDNYEDILARLRKRCDRLRNRYEAARVD